MVSLEALNIGVASCASVYVKGQLRLRARTQELTARSKSGMGSVSGIAKSSSVKPMSRSISISISAIMNGRAVEFAEALKAVLEAEVEE